LKKEWFTTVFLGFKNYTLRPEGEGFEAVRTLFGQGGLGVIFFVILYGCFYGRFTSLVADVYSQIACSLSVVPKLQET